MERLFYDYSLKSIPRPSPEAYHKHLLIKTSDFIGRVRWKCHFFLLGDDRPERPETFGFRSTAPLPFVAELNDFESAVYHLISTVKFRRTPNSFLDRLDSDVARIRSSTTATVPADKTSNLYQVPVGDYHRLIQSSIMSSYRKAPDTAIERIEEGATAIANRLELIGRMEQMERTEAFVLLKDHKPNFLTSKPCRLINPAKSCVGKVSKVIIERVNASLRGREELNQWRSTGDVLAWFRERCSPGRVKFLSYDIESFYPSISEDLLNRAIQFAKERVDFDQNDIDTVIQSRRSLLFCPQGDAWQRQDSPFDVTMGAYDGAETCELVGLYLLHRLCSIVPQLFNGLYRDDGLIMIVDPTGPGMERLRKDLIEVYRSEGLKITISPPSLVVDYLDVTLHADGSFRPYRKADQTTMYVNQQSNHPASILKNIPGMISNRLSSISSNAEVFETAAPYYRAALERSGYSDPELQFVERPPSTNPRSNRSRKKPRKRRILWFNPPFSVTVETNIGKRFLALIDRFFPPGHCLHKIMNRNYVKVAYSCMPNMERIIKGRNRQLLQQHLHPVTHEERTCNCRGSRRESCPLQGNCLIEGVVYQATLSSTSTPPPSSNSSTIPTPTPTPPAPTTTPNTDLGPVPDQMADPPAVPLPSSNTTDEEWIYIGMTGGTFKQRFNQHMSDFRLPHHKNTTKLSEKVWELKNQGRDFQIKWKVIRKGHIYKPGQRSCDLCVSEKLEILKLVRDNRLLNSRRELAGRCRHQRRWKLPMS